MPPSRRTTMNPHPARSLPCLLAALWMAAAGSVAAQSAGSEGPAARRAATPTLPLNTRTPLLSSSAVARSGPAASVLVQPAVRGFGQAQLHDGFDASGSGVHGSTLTARLKNGSRSPSPWRATMRFELSSREQLIIKPRPRRLTIAYEATL
jgi:hypothetical protein